VLNADTALLSTDYRAPVAPVRRAVEVAGRAGRRATPGNVLVQTATPGTRSSPRSRARLRRLRRLAARGAARGRIPPFVFEASLRAEAKKLEQAMAFHAAGQRPACLRSEVRVYDPVRTSHPSRRARARQLVMQSASRPGAAGSSARLSSDLFASAARDVRWHLDVDPIRIRLMSARKTSFKRSLRTRYVNSRRIASSRCTSSGRDAEHGDLSSNVAMQLARQTEEDPMDWRSSSVALLPPEPRSPKPGFINVRLKAQTKLSVIAQALKEGKAFGRKSAANPQKIQVEFVSANPTGPLHVGHGRQARSAMRSPRCSSRRRAA